MTRTRTKPTPRKKPAAEKPAPAPFTVVCARRRQRLMKAMGNGVALFPAAPEAVRSGDVLHRYRQDSDFFYLTGFPEPGAYAVLTPGSDTPYTLYVQPRDPDKERWTGRRAGERGAKTRYGADAAHPAERFFADLPGLLQGHDQVFLRLGADPALDEAVIRHVAAFRARTRAGVRGPTRIVDPAPLMGEFRLRKDAEELALLQRAVDITAEGHLAAMRAARPGLMEFEVEAEVEYRFRKGGASGPAYPTICGGGVNATILHYIENDRPLKRGDLMLLDAGAEYLGYAGDVTRTVPVSGRFSSAQRALYEIVLGAQRAALRRVRPGATLETVHKAAVRHLTDGLLCLGLLSGRLDALIKKEAYKRFYMHRTSHWLGLDVHDAGRYDTTDGAARPLEPGMVLTVEPGLYVDGGSDVPRVLRHQGIRIEDDVLVTATGHRVLSAAVPKDVDAIEHVMANGAKGA
jgi:Xaa-Pro aminopeptidase